MLSYLAENICKCAGIILLRKVGDSFSFVLVETRQKRFMFSFPKGKREAGESTKETAIRETYEETGLTSDHYTFVPNTYYFEYLSNGSFSKPHIFYYVAILNETFPEFSPIDQKEIISCGFYTMEDIIQMKTDFTYQRKVIASKLMKRLATGIPLTQKDLEERNPQYQHQQKQNYQRNYRGKYSKYNQQYSQQYNNHQTQSNAPPPQ